MSHITPTAKRNTYSVAILVGPATQGSGLRPQPWAGKTQLRQSCQGCVPNSDVHGQLYLGGMGLAHGVWCASNEGLAHRGLYAPHGGMVLVPGVWCASNGNSDGVAITQPRVEVRSASTLGANHYKSMLLCKSCD